MTPTAGDRFALIPAVYVVLRRRHGGHREVLLQYRDGTGFMDLHWACGAAGHVEAGESVFQAAVREAREELGIEIAPDALIPLVVVHRRQDDDDPVNQRIDIFFACDEWVGEPATQESEKSSDLRWFDAADLPTPVVPHEQRVLAALASGDLPLVATFGFSD